MSQKIIKVGSSAAVTIPKRALEALGVTTGDRVELEVDKKTKTILVSPADNTDRELISWTEGFIKNYRKALDELAD